MIIEAFTHAFALDLGWFIGMLLGNLHWLFVLIACVFIFMDGKKYVLGFLWLVLILWAFLDFEKMSDWVVFVGGFLIIYYVSKLALLKFAEDNKVLEKWLVPLSTAQGYIVMVLYNIYMV